MNKNPVLNALLAFLYIAGLFLLMQFFLFPTLEPLDDTPNTLIPITMVSLFTLSAAVMGYLFVAQPAMLYLDGKKQEALAFFLKTLGSFAVIVALWVAALFAFIIPALY